MQEQSIGQVDTNSAYIISAIILGLCLAYGICLALSLFCCRKRLNEQTVQERISYAYDQLSYKINGSKVLLMPVVLILRIFIIAAVIVRMQDLLIVQILIVFLTSVMVLSVLSLRPLISKSQLRFEYMGEFTILVCLDSLLIMSRPEMSPESRSHVGWIILAFVNGIIVAT